jgi:general stress protein 26
MRLIRGRQRALPLPGAELATPEGTEVNMCLNPTSNQASVQETFMTTDSHEFEEKLWKALQSDRTVMLGISGVNESHTRPMTAQFEQERGPIWFFASTENAIVQALGGEEARAVAAFTAKGHDLFAAIHGRLSVDTDRAVVDRLWNRYAAAWFDGGKSDPRIALLRLDAEHAEVWIDASSIVAGVKLLLGVDPKRSFKDKVADVPLR